MTRLIIVAEIRFYREGLSLFFADRGEVQVAGAAADIATAVDLAERGCFDVALVDLTTSGATDAVKALRAAAPGSGIVALGIREDEAEVIALAEAGVDGFVSRDSSLEELARAVERAARGETQCSPRVAGMLARRVAALAHQLPERSAIPLTRRQLEIVRLIDQGLPNKVIAQRLFIEVPTVKNHVHNILQRLGVHHREEAVSAVRELSQGFLPSQHDLPSPSGVTGVI
jgi:two-component system nitrate/nitrite response regulator NarL